MRISDWSSDVCSSDLFLDRQAAAIRRAATSLDAEAVELLQETPTTVEITIGCALGYLDLRMPYLEWRRGLEPLADWYAQFAARQPMQKTDDIGRASCRESVCTNG